MQRAKDILFRWLCRSTALLVIAVMLLLVGTMVREAWPAITELGARFLIGTEWNPSEDRIGALPFIYGTLVTSMIAMALAVPFGVGTAAFLAEIATGWVRRVGSFLIELLAAIPSVVYGFWGFYFLRPAIHWLFNALGADNSSGNGLLCAGMILAIMILPYITAITYDVCRAVPHSQREGSLALGSTRWQMIWSVVLPYARPGIVGGCFLAVGRALGETMAVVMLIGSEHKIDLSVFGKGETIASMIALKLNESSGLDKAALVELGLILLLVTVVVNCLARLLIWQVGRRGKRPRWFTLRRLGGRSGVPTGAPASAGDAAPVTREYLSMRNGFAWWMDRMMTGVLSICLLVTVTPLFLILGYVTVRGATALDFNFFTSLPNRHPPGLANAIYGSAVLVGLATLFAVPIGLLAAVFLVEYKTSRLAPIVRFVGELLGGVPSIVIGILGYALLVRPFGHFSGWAGVFALAVIMVPIVMRASEESLKLVPQSLRSASYALGAAHWQTVLRVTIPAALPAIITGVFLAIARIAGETAPLLLTANCFHFWPDSPNGEMPYLTYYIYTGTTSPQEEQRRLAWAAAFVLLTVVMLLNVGIRLATGRRLVSAARAD